jgi:hypothetical protein
MMKTDAGFPRVSLFSTAAPALAASPHSLLRQEADYIQDRLVAIQAQQKRLQREIRKLTINWESVQYLSLFDAEIDGNARTDQGTIEPWTENESTARQEDKLKKALRKRRARLNRSLRGQAVFEGRLMQLFEQMATLEERQQAQKQWWRTAIGLLELEAAMYADDRSSFGYPYSDGLTMDHNVAELVCDPVPAAIAMTQFKSIPAPAPITQPPPVHGNSGLDAQIQWQSSQNAAATKIQQNHPISPCDLAFPTMSVRQPLGQNQTRPQTWQDTFDGMLYGMDTLRLSQCRASRPAMSTESPLTSTTLTGEKCLTKAGGAESLPQMLHIMDCQSVAWRLARAVVLWQRPTYPAV